jgi:D-alanyl-D-alanine carboxypeptidase
VLGQYSLSIPALQQISAARTYLIAAGGKHGARQLLNENQFLWWFPGVDGGKTGFDGVSDFVQVMSVTRNNHHLIGVVIHTTNWWTDMRDLMNYGFNNYTWVSPRDVDAAGHPVPYDSLWNYFATDTQDVSVSLSPTARYYVYSGYTISGAILTFFDKNGGLKKFGFPMKMPVPSNGTSVTQQFQHGSILCNLTNNQCSSV